MNDLIALGLTIARMEAAYRAIPVPTAPDVRPAVDELRPIKPSPTVENVALAIGLLTVAAVLAGYLT